MLKTLIPLALLAVGSAAMAAEPSPTIAQVHADPVAAFQGEWVSRFCSKDYRWIVEGQTVKMYKHDASKPASDYDNRHPVGATIMELRGEFDRSDRGIRLRTVAVEPNGYRSAESASSFAAMTLYWSDPNTKKQPYYSFNEMLRPAEKAKQCK